MSWRKYLQFGRIHSAPITMSLILAAYSLTFGEIDPVIFLVLLGISAVFHWVSFGWNGYFDWERDKNDPRKSHFEYFGDDKRIYLGALIVGTLGLSYYFITTSVNMWITGVVLIVLFVSGNLYNYLGKERWYGPFFSGIAGAMMMFLYGKVTVLSVFLSLWLFFSHSLRDGFGGGLKDCEMWADMLRFGLIMVIGAWFFSELSVIIYLVKFNNYIEDYITFLWILVIFLGETVVWVRMYECLDFCDENKMEGEVRSRVIKLNVVREVLNKTFLLMIVFGWWGAFYILGVEIVWLLIFDYILWGEVKPNV